MLEERFKRLLFRLQRQAGILSRKIKPRKNFDSRLSNLEFELVLGTYISTGRVEGISEATEEDLHNRLSRLSQEHMDIIRWFFYDGLTQSEIGSKIGHSQTWVSRQLQKALDIMHKD